MKRNKTISIIGHFGGKEEFLDGQTVKTKILYDELNLKTKFKIIKVDTYYKNKKPLKLIYQTLIAIMKSNDIIILLSGNGMRMYFPILYFSQLSLLITSIASEIPFSLITLEKVQNS